MLSYNPGVYDRSGEIIGKGASDAATLTMESMSNFGENMGEMMAQFANQYAENKALEAKGAAYGDFMKRHGEQLGFDPTWLDGYLKKNDREKAMIGDQVVGMQSAGKQLMNQEYLAQQMAGYGGGNRGGGGGGAGGEPFMRVP